MIMSKKSYNGWSTWALLLLGLLGAFAVFQYWKKKQAQEQEEQEPEEQEPDDDAEKLITGNYAIIANTLKEYGYANDAFAKLVTAQAMHETGYFTSPVFESNNNYFGMRQPVKRETVSLGAKGGYASFESLKDSVVDYIYWTQYVQLPFEYEAADAANAQIFVKNLKDKGYFEDSFLNYKNGVTKSLNTLKSLISAG